MTINKVYILGSMETLLVCALYLSSTHLLWSSIFSNTLLSVSWQITEILSTLWSPAQVPQELRHPWYNMTWKGRQSDKTKHLEETDVEIAAKCFLQNLCTFKLDWKPLSLTGFRLSKLSELLKTKFVMAGDTKQSLTKACVMDVNGPYICVMV